MYSLALIIFVVSEKKAFEYFPIGSNVNVCPVVVAILDFLTLDPKGKMFQNVSSLKPLGKIETKLPRNDHWKVLYIICSFRFDPLTNKAATDNFCFRLVVF
jgi:hypothetical protein